jgi:hypothetical protein
LLKSKNFPGKVLLVREKVVPLHPLSGKVLLAITKKKSSLKVLHKTEEVVVQEARGYMPLG